MVFERTNDVLRKNRKKIERAGNRYKPHTDQATSELLGVGSPLCTTSVAIFNSSDGVRFVVCLCLFPAISIFPEHIAWLAFRQAQFRQAQHDRGYTTTKVVTSCSMAVEGLYTMLN